MPSSRKKSEHQAQEPLVLTSREQPIAVVTLNRPEVLNALSDDLMAELVARLQELDADSAIRCIVLTGDERAFAAGADIGGMVGASAVELYLSARFAAWDAIGRIRTPVVAAVAGYALGGGCELAMACDTVVAAETARFGQPETGVGIIPGAGGTQRLVRAVGKAVAMDVVLSGRMLSAEEALQAGLVARVVGADDVIDEAKQVALAIASKAPVATRLAKELVNCSTESPLSLGLEFERRAMELAFASEDAREGMEAFLEKRRPDFRGR